MCISPVRNGRRRTLEGCRWPDPRPVAEPRRGRQLTVCRASGSASELRRFLARLAVPPLRLALGRAPRLALHSAEGAPRTGSRPSRRHRASGCPSRLTAAARRDGHPDLDATDPTPPCRQGARPAFVVTCASPLSGTAGCSRNGRKPRHGRRVSGSGSRRGAPVSGTACRPAASLGIGRAPHRHKTRLAPFVGQIVSDRPSTRMGHRRGSGGLCDGREEAKLAIGWHRLTWCPNIRWQRRPPRRAILTRSPERAPTPTVGPPLRLSPSIRRARHAAGASGPPAPGDPAEPDDATDRVHTSRPRQYLACVWRANDVGL
jgi:hypothetical protein